jgi:hypothetical protein
MPISVYVSVGKPFLKEQEDLIASIESHLAGSGFTPRTVGRNGYNHQEPLRAVHNTMRKCSGALIIALERLAIRSGVERPGSSEAARLQNIALATPWNQIEAALAYAQGIPVFVLREKRVKEEGLLEAQHDWYVHTIDLATSFLHSDDFKRIYKAWCRDVRRRAGRQAVVKSAPSSRRSPTTAPVKRDKIRTFAGR